MRLFRYGLIVALLFLVGCMKVEESELYGSYLVRYPFASELLEINKDSTYKQTVIIDCKADTLIHNGKWKRGSRNTMFLINPISSVTWKQELDSNPVPFDGLSVVDYYKYFPWSKVRLAAAIEGYHFEKIE